MQKNGSRGSSDSGYSAAPVSQVPSQLPRSPASVAARSQDLTGLLRSQITSPEQSDIGDDSETMSSFNDSNPK